MELASLDLLSALAAIVVIDLALAGDNAIVIALAARRLPDRLRRRAIVWGTAGAVVVRSAMTAAVVWLLSIPGLMGIGGAVLVWIAVKLAAGGEESSHDVPAATTFRGAMQTIVVADAAMGLDNVLAVAGAARGSFALVVIGLLVSIPIVVWGSTMILRWLDRHPWLVHIGVAVLAWTAAHMIVREPLLAPLFNERPPVSIATHVLVIAGVFGCACLLTRRRRVAVERGAP